MQLHALHPYEQSLLTHEPLRLHHDDGRPAMTLDIERWLAPADSADFAALVHARGPVLDIGCGPGRIVAALAELGLMSLGIDISATAVEMTRRSGLNALQRDVFSHLPGERRWATAVLLDGNIGIGGDPAALLARVRELLLTSGRLIIEVDRDRRADDDLVVRFMHGGEPVGPRFRWARVGLDSLTRHAATSGFDVDSVRTADGRTFVDLLARPLTR